MASAAIRAGSIRSKAHARKRFAFRQSFAEFRHHQAYIRELLPNCPILSLLPWGNEASERMARFYFNLAGKQNVDDPGGLAFEDELQAFRAAERLAKDLASAQPLLRGTTCVVVTRRDRGDAYYVSV